MYVYKSLIGGRNILQYRRRFFLRYKRKKIRSKEQERLKNRMKVFSLTKKGMLYRLKDEHMSNGKPRQFPLNIFVSILCPFSYISRRKKIQSDLGGLVLAKFKYYHILNASLKFRVSHIETSNIYGEFLKVILI